MYLELLITMWAIQKKLLDAYEATNHDSGIGLFLLSHQITSLRFFERTTPPAECQEVHDLCLNCQRLSVSAVAAGLDSTSVPESLLREYERASERFGAAMTELQKTVGTAV